MRKLAPSIVFLLALSFAAIPVGAQTRGRCATNSRTNYGRRYDQGRVYNDRVYRESGYRNNVYSGSRYDSSSRYGSDGYYGDRSVWDRSRDKITTGIGAGAGTVIGSAIGGRKGAIIGAIAGGGGAALYTYVLRNKNRRGY
jgi:hypothetical protein